MLDTESEALILDFVRNSDPTEAANAIDALGNSRDGRRYSILETIILDSALPWTVRAQAVRAQGRTYGGVEELVEMARKGKFPEDLMEMTGRAITQTVSQRRLRDEIAQLFPVPKLKNNFTLAGIQDLLTQIGNTERGKEVFKEATCVECHIVKNEGTNYGPDLSTIGSKLDKMGLYESIVDPSAGISLTYESYQFALEDGTLVVGFIVGETDETITLRLAGGVVTQYPVSEVVSRQKQPLSAMPADLSQTISVEDLVNLVEYLTTLK